MGRRETSADGCKRLLHMHLRNLSHNLGSHALQKVSGYFDERKITIDRLIKGIEEDSSFDRFNITDELKTIATDLGEIKKLLDYFSERSELIAMLASGTIANNRTQYTPDSTLINISSLDFLQQFLCSPQRVFIDLGKVSDVRRLLSIRGGVLGLHAFYAIIENYARNSKKHSHEQTSEKDYLSISVNFNLLNKNLWEVQLVDIRTPEQKPEELDSTCEELNKLLDQSLIDSTFLSDRSSDGRGVLEMKAWAMFLRGCDMTINEEQNPRILSYRPFEKRLSLVFYVSEHLGVVSENAALAGVFTHVSNIPKRQNTTGRWLADYSASNTLLSPFANRAFLREGDRKAFLEHDENCYWRNWIDHLKYRVFEEPDIHLHLVINGSGISAIDELELNSPNSLVGVSSKMLADRISLHWVNNTDEMILSQFVKLIENLKVRFGEKIGIAIWDRHQALFDCQAPEIFHYEEFCSTPIYNSVFQSLAARQNWNADWYRLIETCLTQIVIVDEEQRLVEDDNVAFNRRLARAGCWVINPHTLNSGWPSVTPSIVRGRIAFEMQNQMNVVFRSIHSSLSSSRIFKAKNAWADFLNANSVSSNASATFLHTGGAIGKGAGTGFPTISYSNFKPISSSTMCKFQVVNSLYCEMET